VGGPHRPAASRHASLYGGRVTRRLSFLAVGVGLLFLGLVGAQAGAHSSGCHTAHSCPSDHHTYVWYDGSGQGLDCAKVGAPEYDSARDTQTISYGGYTYYCRAAGSGPAPPTADPAPLETESCGVERRRVKTLTDPAAGEVNLRLRKTSVSALRRLGDPHIGRGDPRTGKVERRTYSVRARLVSFATEDDSDIHLVIADPRNPKRTMIAELPSSGCTKGARSSVRRKMSLARAGLIRECGRPRDRFTRLRGTATLTGVGFYDVRHGQRGLAPNGIELHPVTGFRLRSPRC